MPDFVRFQSAAPNRRGTFPGVFALANGLREEGRLSEEELAWLADRNAHMNATYADPSTVVPGCYDRALHPRARAWFRADAVDAVDLLHVTRAYLDLLDRHDVPWHELRTRTPGRITYEDDVQVVAVPHAHDAWPFP
ncbi:hypothetical protein FGG90_14295 [Clavibacter tessellarius]|uniref:Uncharacterized protein n=1 Tax=Clavibacter tessellarius TaxID=31965 RepID=A0A225CHT3_9MICO|nr:hypothetical protein [Clavibacter michiganensis]OQJ61963.1 hypothetical protein B5P24_02420 [Clavibacter michiganensis subsp. tessellarius]UKF35040.1 hypothetical protein FGG90_14295 [Clavibacter michiganensis subsp. tessellarius]